MADLELRHVIYRHFADSGRAPTRSQLVERFGTDVAGALTGLHDAHMVVLDDDGEIRMALPFSAADVGHRVVAGDRDWWANCAWDAFAIPAALGRDARIESTWVDTGEPVRIGVADGRLDDDSGFVHFVVPARKWWDDIVET